MFYEEKCDFCGKCLEFCPYVDYGLERAQQEMKDLRRRRNTPHCRSLCDLRLLQPSLSNTGKSL